MTALYPWLEPHLASIGEMLGRDRVPHALLLSGQPGMGKTAFAGAIAQLLLCEDRTPDHAPCGQCPGCIQFQAGSHPDFFSVRPEEDSSVIKVDAIRALGEKLVLASHRGGYKVTLLAPAEAMNLNAANSLLKTLEEPSDNTVLVLICTCPARLPATIRSRCQQLRITAPRAAPGKAWLADQLDEGQDAGLYLHLADGAPLEALRLAQAGVVEARREQFQSLLQVLDGRIDPLALAVTWSKDESLQPIHWLRDWLMDLLRIGMTGQTDRIRSVDLQDALAAMATRLDSRALFRQLEHINRTLRITDGILNRQLMTEDILLAWAAQE
ncbi:MAG: DNA polymerase III subunit delta' [Gammaproteobacteria bacterium]|nr:DNA polymerase III subunit delta' [Gammaproteobacteria bacterium]